MDYYSALASINAQAHYNRLLQLHLLRHRASMFKAHPTPPRTDNQMGAALSGLSLYSQPPLAKPKIALNHAAKCFACKGTGERQCPFNPEDTWACECKTKH